jgi:superfamily II DNA or RNA helicase
MLQHDAGVLCAPTAFGKTVTAAALIARRGVNTLVLAMPVSWKGTLQQYAGRLHRQHASKTSVWIVDFVDAGHPALVRMWERRQRGYRAMGYRW